MLRKVAALVVNQVTRWNFSLPLSLIVQEWRTDQNGLPAYLIVPVNLMLFKILHSLNASSELILEPWNIKDPVLANESYVAREFALEHKIFPAMRFFNFYQWIMLVRLH